MRHTKITAGLLALSLTVSAFAATPARANGDDAAKAIGGLIALFAISRALEGSSVTTHVQSKPVPHTTNPRRKTQMNRPFEIPANCVWKVRHGPRHGQKLVSAECVKREKAHFNRLPSNCAQKNHKIRNQKTAHSMACLEKFGYRVTKVQRRHN